VVWSSISIFADFNVRFFFTKRVIYKRKNDTFLTNKQNKRYNDKLKLYMHSVQRNSIFLL
jgi:hypothetical protein